MALRQMALRQMALGQMALRNMAPRWPRRELLLLLLGLELIALWWLLCALTGKIDSVTYLAAGERLNAGHALYSLAAGDRPIKIDTNYFNTPLLYPPLIAVLWRPLAALPWTAGLYLWIAAAAAAVFGAVAYVLRGHRTSALVLVIVASAGIGSQLSGGNVNGFVLLGALLLWEQADRRPWVGAVAGLLTAIKISPGIFLLWLLVQRRWRALAWAVGGVAVGLAVSLAGAGLDANLHAIDILRASKPQDLTPSGITGIWWLTPLIDVAGTALVVLLARRPLASFRAAGLTYILGAPQISLLTLCLVVMLIPQPRRVPEPAPADAVAAPAAAPA